MYMSLHFMHACACVRVSVHAQCACNASSPVLRYCRCGLVLASCCRFGLLLRSCSRLLPSSTACLAPMSTCMRLNRVAKRADGHDHGTPCIKRLLLAKGFFLLLFLLLFQPLFQLLPSLLRCICAICVYMFLNCIITLLIRTVFTKC